MKWSLTFRPFLGLLVLSLACCLLGSSYAGNVYTDYLTRSYSEGVLHWPFLDMPDPQSELNFIYACAFAWDDADGFHTSVHTTPLPSMGQFTFSDAYEIGLRELRTLSPVEPRTLEGISMFSELVPENGTDCNNDAFINDHNPNLWISLDPWFGGWRTCWPIYNVVIGPLDPADPNRCSLQWTNNLGNLVFFSRAYVVPQRIFSTNGWGNLLWDMYGDGRMYFPRYIYEGGFPALNNVVPFDEDFWSQLWFRGNRGHLNEYTFTTYMPPPDMNFQWLDGDQSLNRSWTVQNKGYWFTNANYYHDLPYFRDYLKTQFGGPSIPKLPLYRVITDSLQHGSYGVSARSYQQGSGSTAWINAKNAPDGFTGYLVLPRSVSSGAVASFRRFSLLPTSVATGQLGYVLTLYKPGGLAWSRNGDLLFDPPSARESIASLFRYPLTSDWSIESTTLYRTNNVNPTELPPGVVIPGNVPMPDPSVVPAAPAVPKPPSSGGNTPHFPIPSLTPQTPSNPFDVPGNTVTYSDGGFLVNDGANTIYVPDGTTLLPTGESPSYYDLDLPAIGDLLDPSYYEDPLVIGYIDTAFDESRFWAQSVLAYDYSYSALSTELDEAVWTSYDSLIDANPANLLGNQFDHGPDSWLFENLDFSPVLPAEPVLVMPAPEYSNGSWDWSKTHSYDISEYGGHRQFLFWFCAVAISILFLVLYARLLAGSGDKS